MRSVFRGPGSGRPQHGVLCLMLLVAACGPDETLFLFGGAGGASGQGGDGGSPLPTCLLHSDCTGALAWCDRPADACIACPAGLDQCGGECVDIARDPRHCGGCFAPCGETETCADAVCHCSGPGALECGGSCVDTHTEPLHCGGCDHPCVGGLVCNLGECHDGCDAGLTECSIDGGVA